MHRVGFVATTIAVAALLAGCAADTRDLDAPDSPVARYDWDQSGAEEALLEGTLALIDGCLYVLSEPDAAGVVDRTLPVFPRALASWDSESATLTYGGVQYGVGDFVSAGGGWHEPPAGAAIPAGCQLDEYGEVMLVQTTDLEPYEPSGY